MQFGLEYLRHIFNRTPETREKAEGTITSINTTFHAINSMPIAFNLWLETFRFSTNICCY